MTSHKGQWRGALMISLICAWINGCVDNREAGDLRRHRARYDVSVIPIHIDYYWKGLPALIIFNIRIMSENTSIEQISVAIHQWNISKYIGINHLSATRLRRFRMINTFGMNAIFQFCGGGASCNWLKWRPKIWIENKFCCSTTYYLHQRWYIGGASCDWLKWKPQKLNKREHTLLFFLFLYFFMFIYHL